LGGLGCRRGASVRPGDRRKKLTSALRWYLTHGSNTAFLEAIAEEEGRVPAALEEQPDIPDHLQFVWEAFWRLSPDRQIGFSVGPIPFTAIDRYAVRFGPEDVDAFDRLFELIRAMDVEFVRFQNDRE
jgi:hypothetical protein